MSSLSDYHKEIWISHWQNHFILLSLCHSVVQTASRIQFSDNAMRVPINMRNINNSHVWHNFGTFKSDIPRYGATLISPKILIFFNIIE